MLNHWEVKIKKEDQVGIPWENIEPDELVLTEAEIEAYVKQSAKMPDVYEVRYNKTGSLQGYYVPGTKGSHLHAYQKADEHSKFALFTTIRYLHFSIRLSRWVRSFESIPLKRWEWFIQTFCGGFYHIVERW